MDKKSNMNGSESHLVPSELEKRRQSLPLFLPFQGMPLIPLTHQVGGHGLFFRFATGAVRSTSDQVDSPIRSTTLSSPFVSTRDHAEKPSDARDNQTKGRGIVCKPYHYQEQVFYERVMAFHPELLFFMPAYFGVIQAQYAPQQSSADVDERDHSDNALHWRLCKDSKLFVSTKDCSTTAAKLPFTTFSIPGSPSVSKCSTPGREDSVQESPLATSTGATVHGSLSDEIFQSVQDMTSTFDAVKSTHLHEYAFHPWSLKLYQKIRHRKESESLVSPEVPLVSVAETATVEGPLSSSLSSLPSSPSMAASGSSLMDDASFLSTQPALQKFILLEDLTDGMHLPCILDLKMGRRHYGLDTSGPKRRRQHAKTASTTSLPLALRLCGMQVYKQSIDKYTFISKYDGRKLSIDQLRECLVHFLDNGREVYIELIPPLVERLRKLCVLVRQSLMHFRFYASSLLLLYDGFVGEPHAVPKRINVHIIDFAHCYAEENNKLYLDLDKEYLPGPDVDYLDGLTNLIAILEEIFYSHSQSRSQSVSSGDAL